jgi:hypothetical protein
LAATPKAADGGDYNLFRYCHNDPIDFTDPTGTETKWEPWYTHTRQAIEAGLKQIARLQAREKASEWSGHGAIETGSLRHALGQMQQAMGNFTKALAAWTSIRNPTRKGVSPHY